jgi:hypothetical protein
MQGQDKEYQEVQSFKKAHALSRLLERFGISISDDEYDKIVYEIEEYINKPIYINSDDGKSFHLVNINGTDVIFLYDWDFHCLLTVYYKSWFKKNTDGSWERNYRRSQSKYVRAKSRAQNNSLRSVANVGFSDFDGY